MSSVLLQDLDFILARHPGWEAMRGARLFMTGGTGLFGTWLLLSLLHANDRLRLGLSVTVLTRDPNAYLQSHPHLQLRPDVRWRRGDVSRLLWDGQRYDFLLHLATTRADETFRGADQLSKLDTLYFGTRAALEFARQAQVKKVLFTSSGVVYGPQPDATQGLREDHCGGPNTTRIESGLAEGKRVAEYLCAYYQAAFDLNVVIARCFAFIGPLLPLDLHYAAGNFIRDVLCERPVVVKGSGEELRSYLYLADAMVWLLTLLSGPAQGAYNVGSSLPLRITDLARKVAHQFGAEHTVVVKNQPAAWLDNFKRNAYWPSTEKIKKDCAVDEWTSLADAISRTLQHHRQSPQPQDPFALLVAPGPAS